MECGAPFKTGRKETTPWPIRAQSPRCDSGLVRRRQGGRCGTILFSPVAQRGSGLVGERDPTFFVTACDSPVRAASSTCNCTPSARPARRRARGTRRRRGRRRRAPVRPRAAGALSPSRRTWAAGTACCCRAVSACSAFRSVKKPTAAFRTMTTQARRPPRCSPRARTPGRVAATSRATMRLLNWSTQDGKDGAVLLPRPGRSGRTACASGPPRRRSDRSPGRSGGPGRPLPPTA